MYIIYLHEQTTLTIAVTMDLVGQEIIDGVVMLLLKINLLDGLCFLH